MVLAALSSPAPQRCTFALHSSKSIPRLVLYDKLPKAHNTLLQNTTEPYSNLSGQLNAIIKTLLRDGEPYMKIEAVEEAAAKSTELAMSILHRQQSQIEQSRNHIGFLDLSAEIRNRIYDLVLVSRHDSGKHDGELRPLRMATSRKDITQPSLTRVCRQVRKESLPVFYGANVFAMPAYRARYEDPPIAGLSTIVRDWLKAIGKKNRKLLRIVVFPYVYVVPQDDFSRLLKDAGLKLKFGVVVAKEDRMRY